jgi:stage V sporulation protein G
MLVTGVSITIMPITQPVLAAVSVEFDNAFIVKDIRIIRHLEKIIIAMPSRKASQRCGGCGGKNNLGALYCNDCGGALPAVNTTNRRLHNEIAHPINAEFRKYVVDEIMKAYEAEVRRAKSKPLIFPTAPVSVAAHSDDAG